MNQLVRIQQCPGGLIHLSIGAMAVRLDRNNFQLVAQAIQAAAARLLTAGERPKLNLISK